MTLVIGITGGIASGKSTISSYYRSLGIPIIDADVEARLAVENGEPAYNEIVHYFGETILHKDGTINRALLGEIVFNNEGKLQVLNSIVHPDVRRRMEKKKKEAIQAHESAVILDIPLLFENKLNEMVDRTILVYVDERIQMERLMKRNNLNVDQAKSRINAQMPLSLKVSLTDEIINNNGSKENAIEQAQLILRKWKVRTVEN